ncbi:MAG: apolipoprotein N-acyltransferase [Armatimonadota bacterium]|nr:apolipoprotein N-acyltransferase [Armatimonadota bacterium]MDR7443947.1 apolipoprotein N-acyltransferase [Armatimonadota bacterium]MDR7570045.1 apolipoprotein N-acyltransferase [Armatimonadota bacterium]MDR7615450.1 apolipoprotein N-acyltransferase [Armatimonadota bacterium]
MRGILTPPLPAGARKAAGVGRPWPAAGPARSRYGAAVLSGVLLALSFPHPGWWPLAWGALVPLLLALRGVRPAPAAGVGFLFGLAFYGVLLTWLVSLGFAAYAAVAVFSAGYSALFGALASAATSRGGEGRWVVGTLLAWVVVEWLRSLGTASFPWGLVGYSQWTNLPILQLASVGGVYLVSAAVVGANAGFALLLLRKPLGLLPLILVALAWGWGNARLERLEVEKKPRIPVAAIQPNLVQQRKLDPDYAPTTQETLLRLTREAVRSGARLVVWPEHYWPAPLLRDELLDPLIRTAVPEDVALVATGEIDGRRNSAVVVERGEVVGRHDKARLVPLGEWWADPGPGYRPVPAPEGPAGILLCYEIVYPASARALVVGGARYLVHSSEEGWFGQSAGPVQHLGFAVVRAVELGRDVVRAASIGVSGIIERTGRLQAQLPQVTQGWISGRIEPREDLTPYARWGDLWVWGAAGVLGGMVLPAVLPWMRREVMLPFLLPAAAATLGRILELGPFATGLLLCAVALAVCPDPRRVGLVRARHPASLLSSAGFSGMAVWLVQAGFAAQGIPLFFQLPGSGSVAANLAFGAAEEIWLRGVLPASLSFSPLAAFILSQAGTLLLYVGARGEVIAWHLLSGAAFFLVRRLTGSLWGPLLARGIGDAALWALLGRWPF